MQSDIQGYLTTIQNLRTDRSRNRWPDTLSHRAPHKPLLLISVLDLIDEGVIDENLIQPSSDLIETFGRYWSRVIPPGKKSTMALPFYHLQSDGFWHLVPKITKDSKSRVSHVKSLNQIRDIYSGARLDDELYDALQSTSTRTRVREVILATYFNEDIRKNILDQSKVNIKSHEYSENLLERARKLSMEQASKQQQEEKPVRDAGFRRAIVLSYDHRCAFCGIRVLTWEEHTVVEAAHIKPWSESYNDDPRNGIALCKLCHWTFDQGLMSIDDSFRILASSLLQVNRNIPGHLAMLAEREIMGPDEKRFWPDYSCIKWHQHEIFQR